MFQAGSEPNPTRHVVAAPYPGRGHINPMMNLCKLLTINAKTHLLITFVITEEWLGLIGSEEKPPRIRFATIPNVLPSELDRAADMTDFLDATQTKMAEPFERLLDRLQPPVDVIIADTFLNWAVDVGNRRNIPVASLWPMPASVFSIFYHFDLVCENGHFPFDISERGEERVEYIPGIPSIRLADLPTPFLRKEYHRRLRIILRIFSLVPRAQYLLFNSTLELEPHVYDALSDRVPTPIYTLGPIIPHFNLATSTPFAYSEWLDSQPPASVLYISLASYISVSRAQMDEIADGLRESGVRFLWVVRGEATRLQEKCGGVGRAVPWCEQLRVLCHQSVGGFWTHCGWNSTMEGIYAGVPLITLPLLADQTTISKHVVEDWRIGWDARREARPTSGSLLGGAKICEMVKRFMDLESPTRREMERRARELSVIVRKGVLDQGIRDEWCSRMNLGSFLNVLGA